MGKDLIVKHNKLIEARYSLSITETKIVALLASVVRKDCTGFQVHRFAAKDLLQMLDMGEKNHEALRRTVKRLQRRVFSLKKPTSELDINFLSSSEYFPDGTVELEFSGKMTPYLLQLKENFTSYLLENVLRLNSVYSYRIYELCKQYEVVGERKITISGLRDILEIPKGKYSKYSHFKSRVLNISKSEINQNTDIKIDFTEKKWGRKVNEIIFTIKKNPNVKKIKKTDVHIPKRSSAESTRELEKMKIEEDNLRFEKQLAYLEKQYKNLPKSERDLYESQTNLFGIKTKSHVIQWGKDNDLWDDN